MKKNQKNTESKRPVVGIMTGSFHTENSSRIARVAGEAMKDMDVDVRLYQGLDAARYLNVKSYVDKGFDHHYYSLFGYSNFDQPDILIVSFGTISAIQKPLSLDDFLSNLPDVPVILLEDDHPPKNGICITIDNYGAMKECVEHLAGHGCKDIVFVSGPTDVPDAKLRLNAYMDAMRGLNLTVTKDMIVYGDFTDKVDPLIEECIQSHGVPDAFACANDDMAESVYRVLKARGLTPGKDVCVTGFDDIPAAALMDPPLSTVRQDFDAVSTTAVKVAKEYLEGKNDLSEPLHIPATFIARQSCGCKARESKKKENEKFSEIRHLEDRALVKSARYQNMMSSLMIRNLLKEDITIKGFFKQLGSQLCALGTKRSYICLLDNPKRISAKNRMFVPDQLLLCMYQEGESIKAYDTEKAPVIQTGDLRKFHTSEKGKQVATFLLFYGDIQYGILCVELTTKEEMFYYTLSLEIGSGLRFLYLALKQRETMDDLVTKNEMLDYSATHDLLTGCMNRSGFSYASNKSYNEATGDSRMVAVMGDLDHLKQINDTFGHDAGDSAIKRTAKVLEECLPEGSIIGRTGGDEFACFFCLKKGESFEKAAFRKSVKASNKIYNSKAGKPYYVDVSLGCYEFVKKEGVDLSEAFRIADAELYKEKKKRRDSVIKES
ncbi:MAG: GGDEF domain-containing protein [Lachnospiraceae bacterium]|nr:GGDEF domain-containing protein [Lachnospiraceae bacterium]